MEKVGWEGEEKPNQQQPKTQRNEKVKREEKGGERRERNGKRLVGRCGARRVTSRSGGDTRGRPHRSETARKTGGGRDGGDGPSWRLKKPKVPGEEEPKEERGAPGAGEDAQKEMDEFLAPKEVNTGMEVLPAAGLSDTAGEGVSLASLGGLAA